MNQAKKKGLLVFSLAYAVTIAAAVVVGMLFADWHPLWMVAFADLAGTVTIFAFSVAFNNSSFYDPYWSVKPMVIAVFYFMTLPGAFEIRGLLAGGLMLLYGVRLTTNFARDWPGLQHEDWRYRNFRSDFPKLYWVISFLGFHLFTTILVYLTCIPALYAMGVPGIPIGPLEIVGAVIFLFSIYLSFVADEQMRNFRKDPANKGKIMDLGWWKISRHPNYLGEVLGWWGLFFIALGLSTELWWTGAGALAVTLLFVFISIPLMDKRSLERRTGFAEYMRKTPALFPFPRSK
ncbi:MAG: DUF1295 domain-containing protein [Bacteroidota bacterium]